MKPVSKWVPIERVRTAKVMSPFAKSLITFHFKFILKNKETVSFTSDGCRECIFIKRPKSCVKNILRGFVPQEPYFRMDMNNGRRNCAVNLKKGIRRKKWIPLSKRHIAKKPPATREAIALWGELKQYAGSKTESGNYEIKGWIDNKKMFSKAIHFGVAVKNENSGKWELSKPEGQDEPGKEKAKSPSKPVKPNKNLKFQL
jgi:hypothetical protein